MACPKEALSRGFSQGTNRIEEKRNVGDAKKKSPLWLCDLYHLLLYLRISLRSGRDGFEPIPAHRAGV
jgi:hypothetical protein